MKTKLTDSFGNVSSGPRTVHPSGWAKNSTSVEIYNVRRARDAHIQSDPDVVTSSGKGFCRVATKSGSDCNYMVLVNVIRPSAEKGRARRLFSLSRSFSLYFRQFSTLYGDLFTHSGLLCPFRVERRKSILPVSRYSRSKIWFSVIVKAQKSPSRGVKGRKSILLKPRT
eukprot:sb/3472316/